MLWNLSVVPGRIAPLLMAVFLTAIAQADPFDAVQSLRLRGCPTAAARAAPLRRSAQLATAAEYLARGMTLKKAAERSGYRAVRVATLHVTGPPPALRQTLQESACRTLSDRELRDAGAYQRGLETWVVLAAPYDLPASAQAPALAARATELVNAARARGARCGPQWFAAASPVRQSALLDGVASGHAADMAGHDYFDHRDRAGRRPADRVRAAGYQAQLVGENIAYGPATAEDVVQGWLHSPSHCENLMDPRFVEMGIAYAPGHADQPGLYWVQVLAAPRADPARRAPVKRISISRESG